MKDKQYADWLEGYTGKILLVGINYDEKIESGRMVCSGCGAEIDLDEKDKRKSVYAYEYIITEERKVRRTA